MHITKKILRNKLVKYSAIITMGDRDLTKKKETMGDRDMVISSSQ